MIIYYIDKSILVENGLLVEFKQNYTRDSSGVFPYQLTSEDIDDFISRFYTVVCAKVLSSK